MSANVSELAKYVANLVAAAPPEVRASIRGDVAATELAAQGINRKLVESSSRLSELERYIRGRRALAMGLKAVSLLGGAVIFSGLFPGAVRAIALAVTVAGIADLVFGNHKRLLAATDEHNALSKLVDSVEEVDSIGVTVLRLMSADVRAAVKAYADFMQKLQAEMTKGYKAVREAARAWEREALEKLEVPLQIENKGGNVEPPGKV